MRDYRAFKNKYMFVFTYESTTYINIHTILLTFSHLMRTLFNLLRAPMMLSLSIHPKYFKLQFQNKILHLEVET